MCKRIVCVLSLAGHVDEIDQEHLFENCKSEWNSEEIKSFIKYQNNFLFIFYY